MPNLTVQSAGAVENINFISTEGYDPANECPRYDTQQSDCEAQVLELWGIWNTPSLPLLLDPLRPGLVVLDRVLSLSQIELFDIWPVNDLCWIELLEIELFAHLTVYKQITYVRLIY